MNERIDKLFTFICLDDFTIKEISKLRIKFVPTIVISDKNSATVIYEGAKKCSHWLKQFILNHKMSINKRAEIQRKMNQKEETIARLKNDAAIGYCSAEMEGCADEYSYANNNLGQPKNYIMVGHESKHKILTPQVKQNKIRGNEMKKNMNNIINKRKNDNEKLKQYMEKKQIEAVINYC